MMLDLILDEMINGNNKQDTPLGHEIKVGAVLKDFGVKNEKEFDGVLMNNWNIVRCKACQRDIDIVTAKYDSEGNIICKCGRIN